MTPITNLSQCRQLAASTKSYCVNRSSTTCPSHSPSPSSRRRINSQNAILLSSSSSSLVDTNRKQNQYNNNNKNKKQSIVAIGTITISYLLLQVLVMSSSVQSLASSFIVSTARRRSSSSINSINSICSFDTKIGSNCCCPLRMMVYECNVNIGNGNNYRRVGMTTTTTTTRFQRRSYSTTSLLSQQSSSNSNSKDSTSSSSGGSSTDNDDSDSIISNVVVDDDDDEDVNGSTSTTTNSIRTTPFDGIPAVQITNFSPSYLLQLDNYRGYKRKVALKPLYSTNMTTVTTTAAATASSSSSSGEIGTGTDTITKHRNTIYKKIISDEFFDDITRRRVYYKSDWIDGLKNKQKTIPAILFLYFACLSPAVSFGTIASQITVGSMGVVEFVLSSGISGMLYAIFCGQPMTFIAPTGLTLAFISGLYRFCSVQQLPFFPVYSWVGIWTSIMFVLLGLGGSSQLIRFCTRFTDEIFNALLSINFIYEASVSLKRNFEQASDSGNLTMPFVALAMALITAISTRTTAMFETSKYFNQKIRTSVKNFGPVTIFIVMTCFNQLSWMKQLNVPTLIVPNTFQLANGRNLFINLNAIPIHIKLLCSVPAVLLSALFFMDQNISVRVVNNPDNKLQKGSAYNLDMVALGIITGLVSLVGLPWMCGATVQSLSHVRAMTETRFNQETLEPEIIHVTETRMTGFVVHALLAGSLFLLPLLSYVPIPVVSGIFLFLGRKLMSGNSFLQRIRDLFVETSRLPNDHPIKFIGRKKTTIFTIVQILCLAGLWTFKQNSKTAILFPSLIGLLMVLRTFVLPKFFTESELVDLGDPTPC